MHHSTTQIALHPHFPSCFNSGPIPSAFANHSTSPCTLTYPKTLHFLQPFHSPCTITYPQALHQNSPALQVRHPEYLSHPSTLSPALPCTFPLSPDFTTFPHTYRLNRQLLLLPHTFPLPLTPPHISVSLCINLYFPYAIQASPMLPEVTQLIFAIKKKNQTY